MYFTYTYNKQILYKASLYPIATPLKYHSNLNSWCLTPWDAKQINCMIVSQRQYQKWYTLKYGIYKCLDHWFAKHHETKGLFAMPLTIYKGQHV